MRPAAPGVAADFRFMGLCARMLDGGRLTVLVEVVEMAELERGELMKVRIQVDE